MTETSADGWRERAKEAHKRIQKYGFDAAWHEICFRVIYRQLRIQRKLEKSRHRSRMEIKNDPR